MPGIITRALAHQLNGLKIVKPDKPELTPNWHFPGLAARRVRKALLVRFCVCPEKFLYRGSNDRTRKTHPLVYVAFVSLWKFIAVIVEMTGRLVAMILGIVLMIAGVLISLRVIGAIVGIPLMIVGLLLFIRGIF